MTLLRHGMFSSFDLHAGYGSGGAVALLDAQTVVNDLGSEHHHGVDPYEEFVTWVQSVLRDAEIAIHNGNAAPRRAIWSRRGPVSVLGAWQNARGQEELDALFAYLADSFSNCTSYEFELFDAEVRGDTAYTVGLEHTSVSVDGVPRTYTLRVTQIYRREDGVWTVVHRHGSAPPG